VKKNLTNSADPLLKNLSNRGPLTVTPTVQRPTERKTASITRKLQAWTGPEGSRRLRLPDFKTIGTWRW
jgi:hypothetical protein